MSEPSRKRQKTNDFFFDANDFAADEADEGGDDEEWDDDMDEDVDAAELERHAREAEARYARRHAPTLNQDIINEQRERMPDILRRLEQRYVTNANYMDDAQSTVASEYGTSHIATHAPSMMAPQSHHHHHQAPVSQPRAVYHGQTSLSVEATLPAVLDPNLWLVPCLQGRERYAVEELLKKYFKYIHHPTKKLFIKTAFTTDMNTGHIYVEAYKEIHVRRACEDISGLNTWKLRLVPRNEMVDALTIKAAAPQIKRGQWCRFQRGLYKGDLAQVFEILDQGSRVVLRVVPRIDYGRISAMNNSSREQQQQQQQQGQGKAAFLRRGRPPPKLFNKSEIEMYEDGQRMPEIVDDGVLETRVIKWRGKKYKNGCHLVTMPVSQVEFDVTAAPEEVQLLRSKTGDEDDDHDEELDKVAAPIFQKSCQFVRGDTVRVISGAMTNLIGEVLTTQPNPVDGKITVTILAEHPDLKDTEKTIVFAAADLVKYFKVGCHVKVKRGKYKDETGLIIKVDEDGQNGGKDKEGEVIIFSDLTSRTIRVHAGDITETSEVSTGRDVLGNYALYELVHLSRDVVGVIVSIQNGTFKILDNKDQIQDCRLPDIARHSRDDHAVAMDIDNNQIRIGDVIIPQVGEFKGQRATVKHVYRSVLFCHTKSCTQNSGIFVCRSRLCRLAGGRMRMNSSVTQQGRSDTKNDRRLRMLHKHRSTRDPWMHKTVKVKKGSYKGMIGIVCGCTDQKLHIELHAKCKKIQVKREDVKVINQDGTDIDDNPYNSRNLNHSNNGGRNGGSNEWRGGGGRNHGGGNDRNGWRGGGGGGGRQNGGDNRRSNASAYRQAQTPLIGVQTPAYGDNLGAATPAIGSQTPAMGSQTPGYGGVTPAYGSGGHSSAWGVGGMTPAHNPQTPISPAYGGEGHDYGNSYSSNHNPPPSTHSYHSQQHSPRITHSAYNEPSHSHSQHSEYGGGGNEQNHNSNYHSNVGQHGYHHDANSSTSESEQSDRDEYNEGTGGDPYYFVVPQALLLYHGQRVVIRSVDKVRGVCDVALYASRDSIYQRDVPLGQIQHHVPSDISNARIKVVCGKLAGEIGSLIGIDNEEAVVQLTSTTEVTITPKRTVIIYIED